MNQIGRTNLQRIRYFDGQMLTAPDLRDDVSYEASLRGLHVRAMHDTWGVALGYEVSLGEGGTSVIVGPGIAYDCHGREIVSARTLVLGLPALPTGDQQAVYDLLISYQDETSLTGYRDLAAGWVRPGAATAAKTCCDAGQNGTPPVDQQCLSPTEERPGWRWHLAASGAMLARIEEAGQVPPLGDGSRLGETIPLARFSVRAAPDSPGGRQAGQPDFSTRRHAQGLVRPHVASGKIQGRATYNETRHAWTMSINTGAGGFSQTPFYFVSLTQHPFVKRLEEIEAEELTGPLLRLLLGPFVSLRNPTRTDFALDIRAASSGKGAFSATTLALGNNLGGLLAEMNSIPVAGHWIGLEPSGGCPPEQIQMLLMLFAVIPFYSFQTGVYYGG